MEAVNTITIKYLLVPVVLMLGWAGNVSALVIVGDDTLNGNFNNLIVSDSNDSQSYSNTVAWENIGTGDQDNEATRNAPENRLYDDTRNLVLCGGGGRVSGLDTKYTIVEGDVFDISYVWQDAWLWDDGTDQVSVALFVTDDDTISGARTNLVVDASGISTQNDTFETVNHTGVYTADAGDAGKCLFVEIKNTAAGESYGRLDNFTLVRRSLVDSDFEGNDMTGIRQLLNLRPTDGWRTSNGLAKSHISDKGSLATIPGPADNQVIELRTGTDTGIIWTMSIVAGAIEGYEWMPMETYWLEFNASEWASESGEATQNAITVNLWQVNVGAENEILWTTTVDLDGTHDGSQTGDWTTAQTFGFTINASGFEPNSTGTLRLEFVGAGDGSSNQYLDNVYMDVLPVTPGPLMIFDAEELSGTGVYVDSDTIYSDANIPGGLNNKISSFWLAEGYMATVADGPNGTGPSKVYIAYDQDIEVFSLSVELDNAISFIRVLPWQEHVKKGTCPKYPDLNPGWFYNWSRGDESTSSLEYVPMSWCKGGTVPDAIQEYIGKNMVTHLLSFNEPDDCYGQCGVIGNMCDQDVAIGYHEKLMETGLRLGSPACREGGTLNWLKTFVSKAEAEDMRIDFIAMHWYDWGSNPSQNPDDWPKPIFKRFAKKVSEVYHYYRKPIWITEFNANIHRNTYRQQMFLGYSMPYLDKIGYVERYSYFQPSTGTGDFYEPPAVAKELLWTTTVDLDSTHDGSQTGDWTQDQTFSFEIDAENFNEPNATDGTLQLEFLCDGESSSIIYVDNVYMSVVDGPVLVYSDFEGNDMTGIGIRTNIRQTDGWRSYKVGGDHEAKIRLSDKGSLATIPGQAENQVVELRNDENEDFGKIRNMENTDSGVPGEISTGYEWADTESYVLEFNASEVAADAGEGTQNAVTVNIWQLNPDTITETGEIYRDHNSLPYVPYDAVTILPSLWETIDIGGYKKTGITLYGNEVYTICGSGNNIGGTDDELHFVYQSVTGDGEIIAKVNSMLDSNDGAKAGLMIRNGLGDSSRNAAMVITPGNGAVFQYRTTNGNGTTTSTQAGYEPPYWLKLVRNGTTFTGYRSADGTSWTQVGSCTISMNSTVYVGMCVCANNSHASFQDATFTDVEVSF